MNDSVASFQLDRGQPLDQRFPALFSMYHSYDHARVVHEGSAVSSRVKRHLEGFCNFCLVDLHIGPCLGRRAMTTKASNFKVS
jgi:hypothetical protein